MPGVLSRWGLQSTVPGNMCLELLFGTHGKLVEYEESEKSWLGVHGLVQYLSRLPPRGERGETKPATYCHSVIGISGVGACTPSVG